MRTVEEPSVRDNRLKCRNTNLIRLKYDSGYRDMSLMVLD